MSLFLVAILTATDAEALWDFNPVDISIIFTPLFDYAECMAIPGLSPSKNTLSQLTPAALDEMGACLTMEAADLLTFELDNASQMVNGKRSYTKWFHFIRWCAEHGLNSLGDAEFGDVRAMVTSRLTSFPIDLRHN